MILAPHCNLDNDPALLDVARLQVEALHLEKRALDRRLEFSQEEVAEYERQLKLAQVCAKLNPSSQFELHTASYDYCLPCIYSFAVRKT